MKSFLALALVLSSSVVNFAFQPGVSISEGGPVPVSEGPVFTTTGAFFALSVRDASASAKWYAEKLGLKVVMNLPKADKTAVIVLEGGGLIVELIQHDDALPLRKAAPSVNDPMYVHGITKVGIIVDDLDQTLKRLKERQVSVAYGPFPKSAEQRANLIIMDNAGNMIQFFGK